MENLNIPLGWPPSADHVPTPSVTTNPRFGFTGVASFMIPSY